MVPLSGSTRYGKPYLVRPYLAGRIWSCFLWRFLRSGAGLLADGVLGITDAPTGAAKLAADDVAAFSSSCSAPPMASTPSCRWPRGPVWCSSTRPAGEHHGQQPLGFQTQGRVLQVVVAHYGIVRVRSMRKTAMFFHFLCSVVRSVRLDGAVCPSSRANRSRASHTPVLFELSQRTGTELCPRTVVQVQQPRPALGGDGAGSAAPRSAGRGQHQQEARR